MDGYKLLGALREECTIADTSFIGCSFSVFDHWLEWRCRPGACDECRVMEGDSFKPGTEPQLPPGNCRCWPACQSGYIEVPGSYLDPRSAA